MRSRDDNPHVRRKLSELTGGWTVPQIIVDGKPIGGYEELWRLDKRGLLEELAAENAEGPAWPAPRMRAT